MAIIACPECGANVSDKAPSCVQCGAPLATAQETMAAGATLTTTQGTSKKLKAHSAISGVLLALGIVVFFNNAGNQSEGVFIFKLLLVLIPLIWFLVTRMRIWWHHS